MTENEAALPLFSEGELSGIQTTGSPWVLDDLDPATVPVPLQVVITEVHGPYTARDRKLWTFLLHTAFDELGQSGGHSVKISDINSVFRSLGGEHSTSWIWDSAKRLTKTTVEFEVTLGDERFDTITSLFWATVPRKGRRGNELHFGFPEPLIPIIKQPLRFARLRVHFLIKLSGKYAVTLYEILEGFVNRRDGECRVSIEDLRTWLKVPDGTYPDWRDLRRWVLKPAIEQINSDPLGAGFTVDYEPIRKGRKIGSVVFKLTKTDHRKSIDRGVTDKAELSRKIEAAKATKERPPLSSDVVGKAQELTNYRLDMEEMKRQFFEHWERTGRPDFDKGVAQAFIGFCKNKLKQLR